MAADRLLDANNVASQAVMDAADEEFRFATLNDHEVNIEDKPDESKEDTSTKEDEDEEDEENDEANVLADLLDAKVVTAVMNANIAPYKARV